MFGMAACQTTPERNDSGFLTGYSQLAVDPAFDDALRYQDKAVDLSKYSKIIVEPVVVHFAPNAKGTALEPARIKEVTDYFNQKISEGLPKLNLAPATQPGPGTLRLRAAITGIDKTVPIANIHPAMKLTGLGLGGASMEAEMLDSVTSKRVIAIVESRQGERLSFSAGLQTLGHAKQVIDYWVERAIKNWPNSG
jgi:hypothetical protein